jgi:hypothetical protein
VHIEWDYRPWPYYKEDIEQVVIEMI